jgi:tetratricopeptide (TPR) repeat protein
LRNDNPQNIVNVQDLKQKANDLYRDKKYLEAIKWFKRTRLLTTNLQMEVILLSNISQSFICLKLYEDALEYADLALGVDITHNKSLYRKARSLEYLG